MSIINHTKREDIETLNPYGYTGREIETEELYYYRARYYDAETQRFISLDPIGFASGDFNFYRYVGNSPLNFRDPLGLEEKPYNDDFAMSSDNPASYRYDGAIESKDVNITSNTPIIVNPTETISPNSSEYIDSFEGGVTTSDGRYDYSSTNNSNSTKSIDGGLGVGVNAHLGILGWNKYQYKTVGMGGYQTINVTCVRFGPGVFFGGGGALTASIGPTDVNLTTNENDNKETWSLGAGAGFSAGEGMTGSIAGGPTGIAAVWDPPVGSPGAGLYIGIEACDIEYVSDK